MNSLTTAQRQALELMRDLLQLQALLGAVARQDNAEKARRLAALQEGLSADASAKHYGTYLADCWLKGGLRRGAEGARQDVSRMQATRDDNRRRAGNARQAWSKEEASEPDRRRRPA